MSKSCSIIHNKNHGRRTGLLFFIFIFFVYIVFAGNYMQTDHKGLPSEYFPLKKGLHWKYRYNGLPRQPVDIDLHITEEKEIEGKKYFHFSSWFYLTRNIPDTEIWISWQDGTVYRWDGKSQSVLFGTQIAQAEVKKNDPASPLQTPAGRFTDLYQFQNCIGCADAGSQYMFARDIGIVSVTMNAIWGIAKYELIETNATQANAQ